MEGRKLRYGILGIDAAFDRPAFELHVLLLDRQFLARRDADHLLDQIDAGDEFGDRMLDLQPGVHFEEEERAVLPRHEFHRAGGIVIHRLGQRHGLLAHGAPGLLVEQAATAPPR